MVSNSLRMELGEFLTVLHRLREQSGDEPEYQEFRRCLPSGWPM